MTTIRIGAPPAAEYGRQTGGHETARDEWWSMQGANDAQQNANRQAASWAQQQGASGQGNQAQENGYLSNQEAGGAGGHQAGAVGLARAMASGMAPSEGAYQLQRGLDAGSAQQRAMAGGARGGAALATASGNQQANVANMQQNAFTQAGMLRARDMATGRGMYGTMLGQQREQDSARLGMSNEMNQFNAAQQDKYRLGMGQAALGLGEVGQGQDQTDFGYYQQGMNPVNAQSEAWQQYQSWLANVQRQKVATNNAD